MAALDESSPYKPWFAGLDATGYWLIGNGFTKPPRALTPEKIAEKEPIVRTDNLLGVSPVGTGAEETKHGSLRALCPGINRRSVRGLPGRLP